MNHLNSSCSALAAAVAVLSSPAFAGEGEITPDRVIYVDDDAPGSGDGSSWAAAFNGLQRAFDEVNVLSTGVVEVRIAQGKYIPGDLVRGDRLHPPSVLSAAVRVFAGDGGGVGDGTAGRVGVPHSGAFVSVTPIAVRLRGGYLGGSGPGADDRDTSAFQSVLSGDVLGNDAGTAASIADNAETLIEAVMPHDSVLDVDGLVVTGAGNGASWRTGIAVNVGQPTRAKLLMTDCRMLGNTSGGVSAWLSAEIRGCEFGVAADGATRWYGRRNGIYLAGGAAGPTVLDACVFRGNDSGWDDAALEVEYPVETLEARDCVFEGNVSGSGYAAVFIHATQHGARFVRCRFADNKAGMTGGAVHVARDPLWLEECVFEGNQGGSGGAVFAQSVSVVGCRFASNFAYNVGGAVAAGLLEVRRSTFVSNSARSGGAVWVREFGETVVEHCEFTGNTATWSGGAIDHADGLVSMDRCVFAGNGVLSTRQNGSNNGYGGAVFCASAMLDSCRVVGNSVWCETAFATGGAVFCAGDVEAKNSLFSGNSAIGGGGAMGGAIWSTGGMLRNVTACFNAAGTAATPGAGHFWMNGPGAAGVRDSGVRGNGVAGNSMPRQVLATLNPAFWIDIGTSAVSGMPEAFDGAGNTGRDPLLVNPAGVDGVPGTLDDDPSIASVSSAAVDASSDFSFDSYGPFDTDLNGEPRVVDAPRFLLYRSRVDWGAFEFQGDRECRRLDLDGDSRVNTSDLVRFLVRFGWEVGAGYPGDFDSDGVIGTSDLAVLINRFGCERW